MSRRRPDSGPAISLFPFLAVLLCTMGSLLVLLVIFSRKAGHAQAAAAEEAGRARAAELQLARDELGWRLEQLSGIRDRTAADLARARMQLAGVEEDSRKLADELDGLEREAAALAQRPATTGAEPAEEALRELERRLAADREAVAAARAEGAGRPAYAVVPYEGSNGTRRRPLYIECCIDGVFLQPEGIRLGPADFEGPAGPGNPLASALRAAREHIARQPGESGDPGAQPYPLLLVRPSGVMAYYAAREAIQSWGNEFGYQFIDEDWPLEFPAADPALAAVEQRAIDESRRRLAWLAQSRPARPSRPPQLYRAAPSRGGVVADGGPSLLGDQSRFDWTEEAAAAGRDSAASTGTAAASAGASGDVILGQGGGAGGNAGTVGDRYAGPSRFYAAAPAGRGDGGGDGSGFGGGGGPGGEATGAGPGAAGGRAASGSRFGNPAEAGGTSAGELASAAGGGDSSGAAGGVAGGGAGGAGSPGGSAGGGASGATSAASGQGGGGGAGPSMPGLASAGGGGMTGQPGGSSATATASLAGARGSNWASLATAERPVPLTRPIRIECAAAEFRLLDDAGGRVEQRIPIGTETVTAVDPLVKAVHARVAGWGIAGQRMYWKPELILSETADGAGRRADLERLLADSGLDTRRRGVGDEVRGLPPVDRTSGVAPQPWK